jgi:hypothetical protein
MPYRELSAQPQAQADFSEFLETLAGRSSDGPFVGPSQHDDGT